MASSMQRLACRMVANAAPMSRAAIPRISMSAWASTRCVAVPAHARSSRMCRSPSAASHSDAVMASLPFPARHKAVLTLQTKAKMAIEPVLPAIARPTTDGKSSPAFLRQWRRVPGVIYGARKTPLLIHFSAADLQNQLKKNKYFYNRVLYVQVAGDKEPIPCIVAFLDCEPISMEPINLALLYFVPGNTYKVDLPLDYVNVEESVAVRGGSVPLTMYRKVRCSLKAQTPDDFPFGVTVDMMDAKPNEVTRISHLPLPSAMTPLLLPDTPINVMYSKRRRAPPGQPQGAAATAAAGDKAAPAAAGAAGAKAGDAAAAKGGDAKAAPAGGAAGGKDAKAAPAAKDAKEKK